MVPNHSRDENQILYERLLSLDDFLFPHQMALKDRANPPPKLKEREELPRRKKRKKSELASGCRGNKKREKVHTENCETQMCFDKWEAARQKTTT